MFPEFFWLCFLLRRIKVCLDFPHFTALSTFCVESLSSLDHFSSSIILLKVFLNIGCLANEVMKF